MNDQMLLSDTENGVNVSGQKGDVKNNQRINMSRKMLQDALLRLLAKKHIQEIGVSELCREADLNRSTFYRLYSIPSEVLEDILQNMIDEIHASFSFTESRYADVVLIIYKYVYDHRDVMKLLLRNSDHRIIAMLERKYDKLFRDALKMPCSEETFGILCACSTAGGLALASRWLESDNPLSPEEIAELHCSILNPFYIMK